MIDPKIFNPSQEVIVTRREAILKAARELQVHMEEVESEPTPAPIISGHGFPITLNTSHKTSLR